MSDNLKLQAYEMLLTLTGTLIYDAIQCYAQCSESPAELASLANLCAGVEDLHANLEIVTTEGELQLEWYAKASRALYAKAEELASALERETHTAR
ncbi:MAG: hypothetical protein MRY71_07045 [Algiphilus sp.]|nr:hypothetical protein [Algiphilus sp.]